MIKVTLDEDQIKYVVDNKTVAFINLINISDIQVKQFFPQLYQQYLNYIDQPF